MIVLLSVRPGGYQLARFCFRSAATLRRVLALIFPAGGLVLFIPWRLAAERGADFLFSACGGAGAVGRAQVWGRAQRCGGCGTERSSEFGSVTHVRCPHARARGAPIPGGSEAERPARAAWSALRLLVDVAISF